jgi:hypothetical protein
MIWAAVLAVSILAGGGGPEPTPTDLVLVFYSPFRMSDGHRLDTFEQNALCRFESDPNHPGMRRVWEIVSKAPQTSDPSTTFNDQLVRLQLVHRGLNQTYWVDQRGRVRFASDRPSRRIDKARLAELDNTLEDMCPRTERAKDARRARALKSKSK